jgi:hypothetical protein
MQQMANSRTARDTRMILHATAAANDEQQHLDVCHEVDPQAANNNELPADGPRAVDAVLPGRSPRADNEHRHAANESSPRAADTAHPRDRHHAANEEQPALPNEDQGVQPDSVVHDDALDAEQIARSSPDNLQRPTTRLC